MPGDGGAGTVLVVDDEPEVADMVALQLEQQYSVETAYGGEPALEAIDEDIDVVLLDRRMPDVAGDVVLNEIQTRDVECRVILVSAVLPDYDVLEMPFDDYLCKPVGGDTLQKAVQRQLETLGNETLAEYFGVIAKRQLLKATKSTYELDDHAQYQRLLDRESELREAIDIDDELERLIADFDAIDRT